MQFSDLTALMAVDINPETFEKYRPVLIELGHNSRVDEYHLYGSYLVITETGYEVVPASTFHRLWQFYTPDQASRLVMRTIVRR